MPNTLKDNTVSSNCDKNELIKCLNGQDIADCQEHVKKTCDAKKINAENCEIILDKIEKKKDKVDETEEYYVLKFNGEKNHVLSLLELPESEKDKIDKKNTYIDTFRIIIR